MEAPRLWRAARAVLGLPDTRAVPIDVSTVLGRARALRRSGSEAPWRTDGHAIDLEKLIARLGELEVAGVAELSPPPLEVEPSGHLLIPPRSQNDLALAHVNAVYTAALDAYVELTDSLFAPLRPFMQVAVLLPAALKGRVYMSGDPDTRRFTNHLEWWLDPLPPGRTSVVDMTLDRGESREEVIGRWEKEADRALVNARSYRPEQARWIDIFLKSHELAVHGPLASEELVYEWLWSDLQRIKWVGPGRIAESAYKTLP